jgi:hypothetical protein
MADSPSVVPISPSRRELMGDIDRSMTLKDAFEPWLESRRPFLNKRTHNDYA